MNYKYYKYKKQSIIKNKNDDKIMIFYLKLFYKI